MPNNIADDCLRIKTIDQLLICVCLQSIPIVIQARLEDVLVFQNRIVIGIALQFLHLFSGFHSEYCALINLTKNLIERINIFIIRNIMLLEDKNSFVDHTLQRWQTQRVNSKELTGPPNFGPLTDIMLQALTIQTIYL